MSFTQSAMEVMMVNVRAVLVVGVLGLAACGADDAAPSGQGGDREPVILSTTSIWGDVTAALACEGGVDVEVLLPEGADPHAYEASLADRALMDGADLLIINGLDLEEGLIDSIEAAASGGVPVFAAGDHVDVRGYGTTDSHEEAEQGHADEHEHGHGTFDPHIWLDPLTVAQTLEHLAEAMVVAGAPAEATARCADAFRENLEVLHLEIVERLQSVPASKRVLVTSHDALGYFAERYEMEVVGTVLPTPSGLAEPSAGHLSEILALVEARQVPAIFVDSARAADSSTALAAQVGGTSVVEISVELMPEGEPGQRYVALMTELAMAVAQGLTG